jgi:hypothetical protein
LPGRAHRALAAAGAVTCPPHEREVATLRRDDLHSCGWSRGSWNSR